MLIMISLFECPSRISKWIGTYSPGRVYHMGNRNGQENWEEDFPGGPVVRNLPCNAGDVGLISGLLIRELRSHTLWSIEAHVVQLLSLTATARESMHHDERSHMMQQSSSVLKLRPTTVKYINKYFPKKNVEMNKWKNKTKQNPKNYSIGGNKKVEQQVLLADIRL